MNQINYPQLIKNNWASILITSLAVIVLALVLSLVQPLQYRSRVEFLVIQKQSLTMDAYAASRASEKLASGLATVVRTKSFFDKVLNSNYGIGRSSFPDDEKALRKYWQKNITTSVSPETSLLQVNVYQTSKKEANKIASAIAYVLTNESAEYYGGGESVVIKVVNEPLASNYPVRPNIIMNALSGLIIGLILALAWIIYQENKKINYVLSTPKTTSAVEEETYKPEKYNDDLSRMYQSINNN
jgi:capsular polysaccharide biosynthesis protein